MFNLNEKQNNFIIGACHSHAKIRVRSCIKFGGYYYVVDMVGELSEINGMNAIFNVHQSKVLLDPVNKNDNHADFSFSLIGIHYGEKFGNIKICGRAFVNEVVNDVKGNVIQLKLKFTSQYTIRPLRSSKRYTLNSNINHYFKIVLPPEIPKTKAGLVHLLRETSEYITDQARIINLSRGGACICLPEDLARPLLSAGTMYVVFFASESVGTADNTYLFCAKRLGLGNANCPSGVPVRMEFDLELDNQKFSWRDIHENGSVRLQKFLESHESEIPPDPRWDGE